MTQRLIILHTNDIHGRSHKLAQIIPMLNQIRTENTDKKVLYFDCGDNEDTSNRLSNLTKGRSMHQLMSLAKPDAAVIGNASILRYGGQVLADHVRAIACPLLAANLLTGEGTFFPGLQDTVLLDLGEFNLGIIGVTAQLSSYERFFGYRQPNTTATVQTLAAKLRQQGANAVIVLSHLGLDDDQKLAAQVQGTITAIIGAHSHHLLPEGEWHGNVLVAQAGEFGQHIGRLDLLWHDGRLVVERASVLVVEESITPDASVSALETQIEHEVEAYLSEKIGTLLAALDWSETQECGVANWMADILRARMNADVGLCTAGQAFKGGLPAGDLTRGKFWEVCDSPSNPGVTEMTGAQLEATIRRGLDAELAAERPRPLRGRARGLMHLSGATLKNGTLLVAGALVERDRSYRVAATDFELEADFGYVQAEWGLKTTYDTPTILREAVEEYLPGQGAIRVEMGRLPQ